MNDFLANLLVSLFAGAIAIPLAILVLRLREKQQAKENHWNWLFDCRSLLALVVHDFERECDKAAEILTPYFENVRTIPCYTSQAITESRIENLFNIVSEYRKAIDSLEEEYLNGLVEKLDGLKHATYSIINPYDIPDYLIREYKDNIRRSARRYWDFAQLFWEYAIQMKRQF